MTPAELQILWREAHPRPEWDNPEFWEDCRAYALDRRLVHDAEARADAA